jgi:hypothetical protein
VPERLPSVTVSPVEAVRIDNCAAASVEARFAGEMVAPEAVPVNVMSEKSWLA